MGYCYDARLEIPGWNMPGFDDHDWAYANIKFIRDMVISLKK